MSLNYVRTNPICAIVKQSTPTIKIALTTTMSVYNSTNDIISYINFANPVPTGATVSNAKITLTLAKAYGAGQGATLTLKPLTGNFSANTTYAKRPTSTTTGQVQVALGSGARAAGSTVEFDVTTLMNNLAQANASTPTPWRGWELTTSGAYNFVFFSSKDPTRQPALSVTYTVPIGVPDGLTPGDAVETYKIGTSLPVLTSVYHAGNDTNISAVQVRISSVNTINASGALSSSAWDSGEVATTVPQLDLSTAAGSPPAATDNGAGKWWQMRIKDASNSWSPWAVPVQYFYASQGILSISQPASGVAPTVSDSTPPIQWSLTGRTQKYFQVLAYKEGQVAPIYDSGKKLGTDISNTILTGISVANTQNYTVTVKTWDDIVRQSVSGYPDFVAVSRTFTYVPAGPTAPTGLTATIDPVYPRVLLEWQSATLPDTWDIVRNGKTIAKNLNGADLFYTGTTYRWYDIGPPVGFEQTWIVRAGTTGVGKSATTAGSTAEATLTTGLVWVVTQDNLADPNSAIMVGISSATPAEAELYESGVVYTPLNSGQAIRITTATGGYRGKVVGELCAECISPSLDVETLKDAMLAFRGRTEPVKLVVGRISFYAVIYNISIFVLYGPKYRDVPMYSVSFEFHEVGDVSSV